MTAPLAVLRASMHLLPRLEAEESILTARRTAFGTGSLSREDAQRLAAQWERQAGGSLLHQAAGAPRPIPSMGLGLKLTRG